MNISVEIKSQGCRDCIILLYKNGDTENLNNWELHQEYIGLFSMLSVVGYQTILEVYSYSQFVLLLLGVNSLATALVGQPQIDRQARRNLLMKLIWYRSPSFIKRRVRCFRISSVERSNLNVLSQYIKPRAGARHDLTVSYP